MLYMVECDFADPDNEDAWNVWYSGPKLDELLSMPGIFATQRYKALSDCPAPYLAIHSIESPSVFANPDYKAKGGGRFGDWDAALMTNWSRRLFGPLREMPAVPPGSLLVVSEDADAESPSGSIELEGLDWAVVSQYKDALALDASVAKRVIAVIPESEAATWANVPNLRLYAPLTEKRVAPAV